MALVCFLGLYFISNFFLHDIGLTEMCCSIEQNNCWIYMYCKTMLLTIIF